MENNYKIEGNKVYYKGIEIKGVDVDSFKIINENLCKDKNFVFYVYHRKIEKITHDFELDNFSDCEIEIDDENIFIIDGADAHTFKNIEYNFYKDKNYIYFYYDFSSATSKHNSYEELKETLFIKKLERIVFANVETFEILDSNFSKDKNFAFLHSNKLSGIDTQSFHLLNHHYAKDKNNIYFISYYENLENVTSELEDYIHTYFSSLGNSRQREDFFGEYDYISEEEVNIKKIDGFNIDINSFEVIDGEYAKDKNIIIFEGNKVFSIYEGFEVLNPYFAKDKRNIFIRNFDYRGRVDIIEDGECITEEFYEILHGADLKTFEILDSNVAKDVQNVYTLNLNCTGYEVLPGADSKTFEILNPFFAKDSQNVYTLNLNCTGYEVLPGADSKTFEIINIDYAKDKKNIYSCTGEIKSILL